jgi:hypothetical protein
MKLWRAFLYVIARFLAGLLVILYVILVVWLDGLAVTLTAVTRGWMAAFWALVSLLLAVALAVVIQGIGHGTILTLTERPKTKIEVGEVV